MEFRKLKKVNKERKTKVFWERRTSATKANISKSEKRSIRTEDNEVLESWAENYF